MGVNRTTTMFNSPPTNGTENSNANLSISCKKIHLSDWTGTVLVCLNSLRAKSGRTNPASRHIIRNHTDYLNPLLLPCGASENFLL